MTGCKAIVVSRPEAAGEAFGFEVEFYGAAPRPGAVAVRFDGMSVPATLDGGHVSTAGAIPGLLRGSMVTVTGGCDE